MARTAVLGLPRIGPDRELKFALESFWSGDSDEQELLATARELRADNWRRAREAGVDAIPSGDFSLYDQVLDTAWGVGAIPARFGEADGLAGYFALARGTADQRPLEMTKWFDTNYHYLVPELSPGQSFEARPEHWVEQLRESAELGIPTRPVLIGPFSFLLLSKGLDRPLDALPALVPVYERLIAALAAAGATEVQIDEPCLVLDRSAGELDAFAEAWSALAASAEPELCLATYFAGLDRNGVIERVAALPFAELHLDLVRAPGQLGPALAAFGETDTRLSLGVVDGRNVWATDPDPALDRIDAALAQLGPERVTIAPSCSLLHVPYEAARESGIDPEVRGWLAFAAERLAELEMLRAAAGAGDAERDELLGPARERASARRAAARRRAGASSSSRSAASAVTAARSSASSASFSSANASHDRSSGSSPVSRAAL